MMWQFFVFICFNLLLYIVPQVFLNRCPKFSRTYSGRIWNGWAFNKRRILSLEFEELLLCSRSPWC
jgi:hypothetical protein